MKTSSDEDRNPALNEGKWHQDSCGTRIQQSYILQEVISDLKVIAKFVMYSNIKHLDLIVMYA